MKNPQPGPLGHQPLRAVMKEQRWHVSTLSEELGVSYSHLFNVMRGKTPPSPYLRRRLPEVLGVPLADLFTAAALASRYRPVLQEYHPWARES